MNCLDSFGSHTLIRISAGWRPIPQESVILVRHHISLAESRERRDRGVLEMNPRFGKRDVKAKGV